MTLDPDKLREFAEGIMRDVALSGRAASDAVPSGPVDRLGAHLSAFKPTTDDVLDALWVKAMRRKGLL